MHLATALGFSPSSILFTPFDVDAATLASIPPRVTLNVGSIALLHRLDATVRRPICLRFNPVVVAGAHRHIQTATGDSKFGIPLSRAAEAADLCRARALDVVGIHEHAGSGIDTPATFAAAASKLVDLLPLFPTVRFVDFGGGLPVPYAPSQRALDLDAFASAVSGTMADLPVELQYRAAYGRDATRSPDFDSTSHETSYETSDGDDDAMAMMRTPRVLLEPGKFVIAQAGALLVRVVQSKTTPSGRSVVATDSGFNHLVRPVLYGAHHEIRNLSAASHNVIARGKLYDVVGNMCVAQRAPPSPSPHRSAQAAGAARVGAAPPLRASAFHDSLNVAFLRARV